ncbi:MAG: hemolysin family protein [Tepidisphaeraceae bacterium]
MLVLIPVLIALNAFFVAAEYALVAIRNVQIEQLRAARRRRAARAMQAMKDDPGSAIGAIQLGITLVSLLLGYIGEPAIDHILQATIAPALKLLPEHFRHGVSFAISLFIVTILVVVFSELLPKAMTLKYVPSVASFTGVPTYWFMRVVRPLVAMMTAMANAVTKPLGLGSVDEAEREWHTAEEIQLITAEAAEHGELTSRERSLILNSLALGRRTARAIMIPRVKVAFLDMQRSMDENRRTMNEHLYSRLPLCDGGIDKVIGIVPTREFLAAFHAEGDVSVLPLLARPAVFAPDTIPLDKLLVLLDEKRTQMVILVDEHGGVEGMVTLRDVVDELVGKPIDITKRDGVVRKTVVRGDMPLHELSQQLGQDLTSETSVVTVGGLITERLGRFPRTGDEVQLTGVKLKVLDGDSRLVRRVEIAPDEVPAAEA